MTVAQLTMTATTRAATAVARGTLRDQLERWQCANTYDIVLVFSELVTNAVVHAGGATIISVVHGAQTTRFEVYDSEPSPPMRRETGYDVAGEFGLRIVESATLSWGWEAIASGKRVWAVVPCCSDT